MPEPNRAVLERKLAFLRQFLADLAPYAALDIAARRGEHYAIERLLQLLCESSADIGLQILKSHDYGLVESYRDVFTSLRQRCGLPEKMAAGLMDASAMRNLLTHMYDVVDPDRVAAAVEPALALFRDYLAWAQEQLS